MQLKSTTHLPHSMRQHGMLEPYSGLMNLGTHKTSVDVHFLNLGTHKTKVDVQQVVDIHCCFVCSQLQTVDIHCCSVLSQLHAPGLLMRSRDEVGRGTWLVLGSCVKSFAFTCGSCCPDPGVSERVGVWSCLVLDCQQRDTRHL